MNSEKAPFIRVGLFIVIVIMLIYMPTREFLKMTFMMAVPAVFVLIFMKNKRRFSIAWIAGIILLVCIGGGYIYMLKGLPQQIATHRIVIDGTALLSEGKYELAFNKFSELEEYGETKTMNEKLDMVNKEKQADNILKEAEKLLTAGEYESATILLESVPSGTRAHQKAADLLKSLEGGKNNG